jgi:hypothetical protein
MPAKPHITILVNEEPHHLETEEVTPELLQGLAGLHPITKSGKWSVVLTLKDNFRRTTFKSQPRSRLKTAKGSESFPGTFGMI